MNVNLNLNYSSLAVNKPIFSHTPIFITRPLQADYVSFKGDLKKHKINVSPEIAQEVSHSLHTSTAGHRAEFGSEVFNKDVVELITLGAAKYVKENKKSSEKPVVLVGGDTREATRKSIPLIEKILCEQGIDVMLIDKPIPTPIISLIAENNDIDLAVLLTASHNPWNDGGYNFITADGAIAPANVTGAIGDNVVEIAQSKEYVTRVEEKGKSTKINPYEDYKNAINRLGIINWDKIKDLNIKIYYDSLQGAGGNVVPKLLNDYGINFTLVNSKGQKGPHPTKENLKKLTEIVENEPKELKVGFSNDGDADRLGVIDENGNYIHPNDILMLVACHLVKNKGIKGDIVRSQATSSSVDCIAEKYGLNVIQTPVGFKFLGKEILRGKKEGNEVLVAGEESGGLTIHGHVAEKDGILGILAILDLMAEEGKPIGQILSDYRKDFHKDIQYKQFSVRLKDNSKKEIIMKRAEALYNNMLNGETDFHGFEIDSARTQENMRIMKSYKPEGDGFKFYFTDGSSIIIRKSGTEPLVRGYAEAYGTNEQDTKEKLEKLLQCLNEMFALD